MGNARLSEADIDDLYRRTTPAAVRMAYLITGDQGTAEDIVHDVFIRLVLTSDAAKTWDNPGAYLNKSVVNEITSHRRRITARLKRQHRATAEQPPPVDELGQWQERDALLQHIDRLPVKTRTVLVLTYFYDHPDQEISNVTGWPIGTIKSLRSRGLKELRKDFAHDRVI